MHCVVSCSPKKEGAAASDGKESEPPNTSVAPVPPSSPRKAASANKAVPNREPLRENPNFKPEPAAGSQKIDAIAQRIHEEFHGVVHETSAAQSKFGSLWRGAAPASFAQTLGSAALPEVANGKAMPHEAAKALLGANELNAAITAGRFPFTDANMESFDAILTKLSLALSSTTSGIATLPEVLKERMNALPPTTEDLAALLAVEQALREMRTSGPGATPLDQWRPLANARNPIYRYLALLAAPHTTTNGTPSTGDASTRDPRSSADLLSFYQPYLSEQDDLFVERAVLFIGSLGTSIARQTLESFAKQQRVKGSEHLSGVVEIAIQDCDAMIRFAHEK